MRAASRAWPYRSRGRVEAESMPTEEGRTMSDRETVPDPEPRWDQMEGKQWGATPEPVQQPAPSPPAAKSWSLALLGLVIVAALALLIVAIINA
jgi:hypothetical protein